MLVGAAQVSSTSSPAPGFWAVRGLAKRTLSSRASCNTSFHRCDRHAAHGGTFRRGDGVGDHHGLVGIAPPRVELIYLAFGNYTTLGYADLVARSNGGCF